MSDRTTPPAFKVFVWSLAGAIGGMYGSFRAVNVILERFFPRLDPMLQAVLMFILPLGVGMATAVTAGVAAGKALRD